MAHRYFQYLAGDRRNEIVIFDKITQEDGMVFVEFKDGSRCNQELIVPINDRNWQGKLMAEISDPKNAWNFKTEWVGRQEEQWATNADGREVCVQPFVEGKQKIVPVFPKHVALPSNFGTVEKIVNTPEPMKEEEKAKKKFEGDPVWGMMEAAKKFPTAVSVEMIINLPKKSLFDVAEESFENGGAKVVEYIIENLDISAIKDALRNSLYAAYGNAYGVQEETEEKVVPDEFVVPEEMFVPEGQDAEVGEIQPADEETLEEWKQRHAQRILDSQET